MALCHMLEETVGVLTQKEASSFSPVLTSLFTTLLDYRASQKQVRSSNPLSPLLLYLCLSLSRLHSLPFSSSTHSSLSLSSPLFFPLPALPSPSPSSPPSPFLSFLPSFFSLSLPFPFLSPSPPQVLEYSIMICTHTHTYTHSCV